VIVLLIDINICSAIKRTV